MPGFPPPSHQLNRILGLSKNDRFPDHASHLRRLSIPRERTRLRDVLASGGAGSAEAFLTRTGCPIRKAFRTLFLREPNRRASGEVHPRPLSRRCFRGLRMSASGVRSIAVLAATSKRPPASQEEYQSPSACARTLPTFHRAAVRSLLQPDGNSVAVPAKTGTMSSSMVETPANGFSPGRLQPVPLWRKGNPCDYGRRGFRRPPCWRSR